jgi:hypothetical protein
LECRLCRGGVGRDRQGRPGLEPGVRPGASPRLASGEDVAGCPPVALPGHLPASPAPGTATPGPTGGSARGPNI